MQLEQVNIALRPRHGWEAIDLGFRMAMHWARPLWSVWLALYVPVGLALAVALKETPWVAALLLWWWKPLFDRFALHVLSRAVFGRAPTLAETFAAWREILSPGLAWSLLSRFWDFKRSFVLPVLQLERQTGSAARVRSRLLSQRAGPFASVLTVLCLHFETVATLGILALATLFATDLQLAPEAYSDTPGSFDAQWTFATTLIYMAAVSVIEPFYVAAGFALYLNRRVLLEGWDVELGMRRLAQRQEKRGGVLPALLLLGLLGFVSLGGPGGCVDAAELGAVKLKVEAHQEKAEAEAEESAHSTDPPPAEAEAEAEDSTRSADPQDNKTSRPATYRSLDTPAHRAALEVLADPTFGSEVTRERWRPIKDKPDTPTTVKPRERTWFDGVVGVLAELFRVFAWIALAGLVIALALLLARHVRAPAAAAPRAAPPSSLFGLAIDPASLPPDIVAAARAALAAGRLREALSLLYRGALSQLLHAHGLRIGAGATEHDVLALARHQVASAASGFFEALLPLWMASAYGGREPVAERVEALCAAYDAALRPAAAAAGEGAAR
jgi:hypothetical protein